LRDQGGAAMAFAYATLDGVQARQADNAGLVVFAAKPGWHTVTVVGYGYEDSSIEIFVDGK